MSQESDIDIEKWKLKKLITMLDNSKGAGTSMISLLMPPNEQLHKTNQMLTNELGTATNIKSRVNRQSVISAITKAQQKLKLYNKMPPNGLVVLCGTCTTPEGSEKELSISFEPFRPVPSYLYICDNRFHTEQLKTLLQSDERFGFIIIDGNGCLFGSLCGATKEVIAKFDVDLPKKHHKGGQSAGRFFRLRIEKRHNYVKKVAEMANKVFLTSEMVNVKGIVLAGNANFKNQLVDSKLMDERVSKAIIKIVDVSYGDENGFQQAIELSVDALKNVQFVKEKAILQAYMTEIAKNTDKTVFGLNETMQLLEEGIVENLIVSENITYTRYVYYNKETEKQKVIYNELKDPLWTIKSSENLLEWINEHYKEFGVKLNIVGSGTAEGTQFLKGFGGVGGILRYVYKRDDVIEEDEEINTNTNVFESDDGDFI